MVKLGQRRLALVVRAQLLPFGLHALENLAIAPNWLARQGAVDEAPDVDRLS